MTKPANNSDSQSYIDAWKISQDIDTDNHLKLAKENQSKYGSRQALEAAGRFGEALMFDFNKPTKMIESIEDIMVANNLISKINKRLDVLKSSMQIDIGDEAKRLKAEREALARRLRIDGMV